MSGDGRMHLLCGILDRFAIYGDVEAVSPYGSGHINDTFASRWNQAGSRLRYIHQRINERVFLRPDQVMENIERVTAHIARKLAAAGAMDRSRRVLRVVPSRSGEPWVRDGEGGWWRTYLFVEDAATFETAETPARARLLGSAVGTFQAQLADLGGPRLHETIPGFHDMEARYRRFDAALEADTLGRSAETREEIAFIQANRERGAVLSRSLREGRLPERICHNDTKMNNILIDEGKGEGLCVTDLDTVMPGTPLYDVGDLVRTVTTRAEEDERDLSRVSFDLSLYGALLDGYVRAASPFLARSELELLTESGRAITQIMALRFLTDYLAGDHYYRIARPGHNLDRCRTQIALISSMDAQWAEAEETTADIIARYASVDA